MKYKSKEKRERYLIRKINELSTFYNGEKEIRDKIFFLNNKLKESHRPPTPLSGLSKIKKGSV